MGFSLSALGRTGVRAIRAAPTRPAAQGVYVSIDDLAALEMAARDFSFLPRQPVHSILAGRHTSRVRGRGLPAPDGSRGDLYVTLVIDVPSAVSAEERKHWEKLAELGRRR